MELKLMTPKLEISEPLRELWVEFLTVALGGTRDEAEKRGVANDAS
jgi:hypothetical protein